MQKLIYWHANHLAHTAGFLGFIHGRGINGVLVLAIFVILALAIALIVTMDKSK